MVGNSSEYAEGTTEMPDLSAFEKVSVDNIRSVPIKGIEAFNPVIMDIETTGTQYTDEVTVIGIRDVGAGVDELYVREDVPGDAREIPTSDGIASETGFDADVTVLSGEESLFDEVRERVLGEWENDDILVTFNGAGFDIPVLAMRSEREYQKPHPFRHVRHLDPYKSVRYGVHTNRPSIQGNPDIGSLQKKHYTAFAEAIGIDTDELPITTSRAIQDAINQHGYTEKDVVEFAENELEGDTPLGDDNTLDGVYEMIEKDTLDYEPFDSSSEAVTAWENGNVRDIALHNAADLEMTERVFSFAVRQLSLSRPRWL